MRRGSVIALLAGVMALAPLPALATPEEPGAATEAEATPATSTATPPAAATPLTLKPESQASPRTSTDIGLATKVGACALIVGAGIWAFKRRRSAAKGDPAGKGALSLVSRLPLGARIEVCVVEVEGQRLVLGVTPQSICTLSVTGLESALVEEEPRAAQPRAAEPRAAEPPERPLQASATRHAADPEENEPDDEEQRPSWRQINQTGVQRISKAPPEALLRLFERRRSVSHAPAPVARTPERDTEPSPREEVERTAAPMEQPEVRRPRQDATRSRTAGARATLEGQARGLAALRTKR